jgi:cell division transport system ATP-binding protein
MANEPLVLLADEPTGNLDEQNSRDLLGFLRELNIRGATIIAATHEVGLAGEFGKRILNLKSGALDRESK